MAALSTREPRSVCVSWCACRRCDCRSQFSSAACPACRPFSATLVINSVREIRPAWMRRLSRRDPSAVADNNLSFYLSLSLTSLSLSLSRGQEEEEEEETAAAAAATASSVEFVSLGRRVFVCQCAWTVRSVYSSSIIGTVDDEEDRWESPSLRLRTFPSHPRGLLAAVAGNFSHSEFGVLRAPLPRMFTIVASSLSLSRSPLTCAPRSPGARTGVAWKPNVGERADAWFRSLWY